MARPVKLFERGQRVRVLRDHEDRPVNLVGRVERLRRSDDCAWIELDERCVDAAVHPFPDTHGDPKGRWVLAFPGDCERV